MKFTYDTRDGYLLDTEVENIFISEYMVTAPGEYVKVYLYALMCAQMGQMASFSDIAKQLSSSEEDVRKAFLYWKEKGAVKTYKEDDEDVLEFVSLRSVLFYGARKGARGNGSSCGRGNGVGNGAKNSPLLDEKLATLYKDIEKITGRPVGAKEPVEIVSWIDDFGANPEMIKKAYSYCKEIRKTDAPAYVAKVVKSWALKGLTDAEAIDEFLEEHERIHFLYRRVFKALGFARHATEEERRIMEVWFGEMNLPLETVLEACKKTSGITNPNINYIDKVLKNQYKEGGGALPGEDAKVPAGIVLKYYDYIRENAEAEARKCVEEIYAKVPEIKALDEEIRISGREMSRVMISSGIDKKDKAAEIRRKVDKMLADKAAILTENGYPADYMDVKFKCKVCGDTGTTETGERCGCFSKRQEEAKEWQTHLKTKTNFS